MHFRDIMHCSQLTCQWSEEFTPQNTYNNRCVAGSHADFFLQTALFLQIVSNFYLHQNRAKDM